jgi:hypothetical protein
MSQEKVTNISASKIPKETAETGSRRRTWTSKQKLEVLVQLEELKKNGADVGAYIRKQGLYSSTISLWRKQRNEGILVAAGKKRGPKSKVTSEMIEIQKLQKNVEKLEKKLEVAQKIIETWPAASKKKLRAYTFKRANKS